MITVTTFKWVPPFARGQVRDLRVRWALEEAGIPYQERLITFEDKSTPQYRAIQPFGQVPAIEEDGLPLFESGAIVLHIGERSEALLPGDPYARARAVTWLIAALNAAPKSKTWSASASPPSPNGSPTTPTSKTASPPATS